MSRHKPVTVRQFEAARTENEPPYTIVKVTCGDHHVEIAVTAAGRRWHVYIDGEKVR